MYLSERNFFYNATKSSEIQVVKSRILGWEEAIYQQSTIYGQLRRCQKYSLTATG